MKPVGFTNLDQIEALEVIKIVIPTMDFILANVENITEHFNRMLEIHDGIIDAPGLYQEETFSDLIACLDQSFVTRFLQVKVWQRLGCRICWRKSRLQSRRTLADIQAAVGVF